MAKDKILYICESCQYQATKWMGKCPECGTWNSFTEEHIFKDSKNGLKLVKQENQAQRVNDIETTCYSRIVSGINEFDRVVGGGLVQGSLVLVGGEPGIGKSTLLTKLMGKFSEHESVLYVSGEESVNQVADRARRLNINHDKLFIYNETCWQQIKNEIKRIKPKVIVIDSIQTTASNEINSPAGTISQVREVTYELMNHVKNNDITCLVIGHITKQGSIAGPKVLEHMVDTVIYFEGGQYGQYRMLRVNKNRFGNTNEVGIFEMQETGLKEVKNPAQYFLEDHLITTTGRCLTCIVEGSRPLFVEIQALVVENKNGNGRRVSQGVETSRLSMLVAIIEKYIGESLAFYDIYLNVVGGVKLNSRESDLSILVSLLSSYREKHVPEDSVFIGEVGLTGEVRSVSQMELRIKELAQLNYKSVVTSYKSAKTYEDKFNISIKGIKSISQLDQFLIN